MLRAAIIVVVFGALSACTFKPIIVGDAAVGSDAEDRADHVDVPDVQDVLHCPGPGCPPSNDELTGAILLFSTVSDAAVVDAADVISDVDADSDAGSTDATDDSLDAMTQLDASVLDVSPLDVPLLIDTRVPETASADTIEAAAVDATRGDADAGTPGNPYAFTYPDASTVLAGHSINAPCDPLHGGADVFYRFSLGDRELVYVDTLNATWRTILFFTDGNGTPIPTSEFPYCDINSSCVTPTGSQVVGLFEPGTYYLVLSGFNGATGVTDLQIKRLPVGHGAVTNLALGNSVHDGQISVSGYGTGWCPGTADGESDVYWWSTCPHAQTGSLTATVCPRNGLTGLWSGLIYRNADYDSPVCGTSTSDCLFGATLTAIPVPTDRGLNAVYVAGHAANYTGNYELTSLRP